MRLILFFLPEGNLKIARQFTAGYRFKTSQVPKGRLNAWKVLFRLSFPFLRECLSRPFVGTRLCHSTNPPLKEWAVFKSTFGISPIRGFKSVSIRVRPWFKVLIALAPCSN